MTVAASVFLGLAAIVHVYIFVLESVRWRNPATWRIFGLASQADADLTAALAYNQGFYNLFLAIGAFVGVVLLFALPAAGYALGFLAAGSMLAAAIVLLSTGRSRLRSAAVQGTFPLLAVVFLLLSLVV